MAEPEETYIVRLLFEVPATGHAAAVERVVDQLARHGIIDWVYRSQRLHDGDIEHYNGDLEQVSLERLKSLVDGEQLSGDDTPDIETINANLGGDEDE